MAINFVPGLTASIGVTDMDRSIAWYKAVLGLTLQYRVDDIGWCELTSHMADVTVGLSQNEHVTQGGGATNVWSVADVDQAKQHLDALGVRQDGPVRHIPGLVKLLTFFDPDGNAMMFAQSLTGES